MIRKRVPRILWGYSVGGPHKSASRRLARSVPIEGSYRATASEDDPSPRPNASRRLARSLRIGGSNRNNSFDFGFYDHVSYKEDAIPGMTAIGR
jgi:hypothetical protein